MNESGSKMVVGAVALLCMTLSGPWTHGDVGMDSACNHVWAENVGWVNVAPSGGGVMLRFNGEAGWLNGYAWGENIGWIKMGADGGGPYANTTATNWGVNIDGSGALSGYAWGENVGWINFGHAQCDVTIDTDTGEFSGYTWGENIGWLKWRGTLPDYGARTLAFDTQAQGTPNWWLDWHGVAEEDDEGDGVPAWQEYVADTDPNDAESYLRITAMTNDAAGTEVVFAPSSTRRVYTLSRCAALGTGAWSPVAGQVSIAGIGGAQRLQDTNTAARTWYRIVVATSP
jgi:hypothetical protein